VKPRRVIGTLTVLAVSLVGVSSTPGAQAVTGSPPVTAPDSVTVYQGNIATLEPINNDHDPDNDQLALCRLEPRQVHGLVVVNVGNEIAILAKPGVKPGAYTLTYYACDFSYLTPGTITVTVVRLPKISVQRIPSNPGHLRVTNPSDLKIRFLYGSPREKRPDGTVAIDKESRVVIPVHRTRIFWIAFSRKAGLIGQGHVDGIVLDRAAGRGTGHVSLSARLLAAWRTAAQLDSE
jgi:hypothetical protein